MTDIRYKLGNYETPVTARLRKWEIDGFARRLWAKDYTLWSKAPAAEITDRLGWLELPRESQDEIGRWDNLRAEILAEATTDLVLLGMGGSSLAPEVFQAAFGAKPPHPRLVVLDSTHPGVVAAADTRLNLARTIFLVSSKSGATIETTALFHHFYARVAGTTGKPGRHFVAITDPGSALAKLGADRHFRAVVTAPPDVGGRYSALSAFGLLPACLIGVDVRELLKRTRAMAETCGPAGAEPGLKLGAALGELALAGRDKVTFIASPSLASFPQWLEQLLAESSGKDGKGLIPIVDEPVGAPPREPAGGAAHARAGTPPEMPAGRPPDGATADDRDRAFVSLALRAEMQPEHEARLRSLEADGQPVIRIELDDLADLAAEMFRWEIAVAAACAVLEVHPFNQPDVELSKQIARQVMREAAAGGQLAPTGGAAPQGMETQAKALTALLAQARPGNYVAIQAYLAPAAELGDAITELRLRLQRLTGRATTFGYGPRFLHSTGQLHKGGPASGIFIQLVDTPTGDIPLAELAGTWAGLLAAQAVGDYQALLQRNRRVLRVDLGLDPVSSLRSLTHSLASSAV